VSKYIAIAGRKGGVGKSSCALGLAAHWLREGKSVVLVDLDPQGSASLAVSAEATGEGLRAALAGEVAATAQQIDGVENLYVLAGGPAVVDCEAPIPLRTIMEGWTPDYVLIDCPPGHPHLDRLAIEAADIVLACSESHRLAIAGAARVLDDAKKMSHAPACALVLGRMDSRRGLDAAAPELLAGAFGVPVLQVRQDSLLAQALNSGQMPPEHGRASEDFAQIAHWINQSNNNI
jgi:chromosome partitioning protein